MGGPAGDEQKTEKSAADAKPEEKPKEKGEDGEGDS